MILDVDVYEEMSPTVPADDQEKRLYQAVLAQTIIDATTPIKPGRETNYAKTAALIKQQAVTWLRTYGSDFKLVCWRAGFDPKKMFCKVGEHLEANGIT